EGGMGVCYAASRPLEQRGWLAMRAARRSHPSRPVQFTPISGASPAGPLREFVQMARKPQAEQWAECRRQHDEEERRERVLVITEFDAGDPEATMHALADEILKHRLAVRLLAQAIGWAGAGAPFGVVGPGPHWRPRRTPEMPDVAPDDADGASPAA